MSYFCFIVSFSFDNAIFFSSNFLIRDVKSSIKSLEIPVFLTSNAAIVAALHVTSHNFFAFDSHSVLHFLDAY